MNIEANIVYNRCVEKTPYQVNNPKMTTRSR